MSIQHLKSLVDLTSLPCISKSDLQQAIETAYPYPHQGMFIWQPTAPDVVANTELSTFIWGKTVDDVDYVPTGEFYYYNGSSWQEILLIDGSKLANGSVSLTKLDLTGSSPYYIIQVNNLGTALIWTDIINAIQNNTLPSAKLVAPDLVNNYILTCLAGVKAFVDITAFFTNNVPSNVVKVDSLVRAGADALGFYLRTKLDGSAVEWSNVDVANLAAAGYNAGESIKRNAANTGWEAYNVLAASEAYDTETGTGVTLDITLTKPAGKTWKSFEVAYMNCTDNVSGGGNVSAAFTWQTAPLAGIALSVGATTGAGNAGQVFVVNNSDDAVSPVWRFMGTVPAQLIAEDTIAIRVTVTLDAALQILSGSFIGKGVYA